MKTQNDNKPKTESKGMRAMTDRYERIRKALEMEPTPGPYEIYQDGGRFYVETTTRQSRCGVFKALGSPESERLANAKLAAACDPDTIRALLAELDELVKLVKELAHSADWNRRRVEMLSRLQKHMRDPERTLVCDILANGQLLPDPDGKRYGFETTGNEHLCRHNVEVMHGGFVVTNKPAAQPGIA